jgi:hypothetical protein
VQTIAAMELDEYRMLGCTAVLPLLKRLAYEDVEELQGTGIRFVQELVTSKGFILAQCLGEMAMTTYLFHLLHCRFADYVHEQRNEFTGIQELLMNVLVDAVQKKHGDPVDFDDFFINTVQDETADARMVVFSRIMCVPRDGEEVAT